MRKFVLFLFLYTVYVSHFSLHFIAFMEFFSKIAYPKLYLGTVPMLWPTYPIVWQERYSEREPGCGADVPVHREDPPGPLHPPRAGLGCYPGGGIRTGGYWYLPRYLPTVLSACRGADNRLEPQGVALFCRYSALFFFAFPLVSAPRLRTKNGTPTQFPILQYWLRCRGVTVRCAKPPSISHVDNDKLGFLLILFLYMSSRIGFGLGWASLLRLDTGAPATCRTRLPSWSQWRGPSGPPRIRPRRPVPWR